MCLLRLHNITCNYQTISWRKCDVLPKQMRHFKSTVLFLTSRHNSYQAHIITQCTSCNPLAGRHIIFKLSTGGTHHYSKLNLDKSLNEKWRRSRACFQRFHRAGVNNSTLILGPDLKNTHIPEMDSDPPPAPRTDNCAWRKWGVRTFIGWRKWGSSS